MLRVTTEDNPRVLVFRLEGRLEGPWVGVLGDSWRSALAKSSGTRVCVVLSGVTFVDAAGKARLGEMHREGAQLIADDPMTKAIVAEIEGHSGHVTHGEAAG